MTSKQEIFDIVSTHLLSQNKKSVNSARCCRYRGLNGLKCAVGILIPDEEYEERFENNTIAHIFNVVSNKNFVQKYKKYSLFISDLQRIHDFYSESFWRKELISFAIKEKLNYDKISNECE